MRRWLTIIGLLILTLTVTAQQMEIQDFKKQSKGVLNIHHVVTDKQQAIIDLKTGENGFTFLANGKTEVQAEESDGAFSLKVPHKTTFLVVKHPDYGQLTWKVPGKGLKKKQHYEAFLLTFSPDKEYKLQKQWVVFEIEPKNAIVTVDSTTTTTRSGVLQFNLPIGKHGYKVESPFHKTEEGTFELEDTARLTMLVALQPFYSYLTVRTPLKDCKIHVDGKWIGNTQATSGHLNEGRHHLTVLYEGECYYDADFTIGKAEKKTLQLMVADLYPRMNEKKNRRMMAVVPPVVVQDSLQQDSLQQRETPIAVQTLQPRFFASVTIKAPNDSTEIWVDREMVGTGSWEGRLADGYHIVNTRKDGLESRTTDLWIEDENPVIIELMPPMTAYGLLNVHSNEVGAKVYVNGVMLGVTPCVVDHLPAGMNCKIRLSLEGFWDAETEVQVIANDMVDVDLKLKREQ